MDYEKEVASFYDWLETNTLTDSAIVMWHALMHTCNRAGWPDEFAVALSTLSTKTGLKKDAINRARLRLEQAGRIRFKSRSGQQSAIYEMIPFAAFKPTQSDCGVLSDTNRVTNRAQTASQTAHKPLPLKELKSSSTSASAADDEIESLTNEKPETFYRAHERVFGFSCNPMQAQRLGSYLDDGMEEAVLIRALERAALASVGYSFPLIERVVKDYYAIGAMDIAAAEAFDATYDAQKSQQGKGQKQKASHSANNDLDKLIEEEEKRRGPR